MKNKPIDHLRRALLLGAITIMGFSSATINAQDWEIDDALPGGGHGDTIIQLSDGSLLNAFHMRDDGESNNDDDWVVRWKPNEVGAVWETVDYWQKGGDLLEMAPYGAASFSDAANNTIEVYVVGRLYLGEEVTTGKGKKKKTTIETVSNWAVRKGVLDINADSWTWDLVQSFNNDGTFDRARDVAVDSQGNVFVTGWAGDDWLTEVSHDGGTTWVESDRWRFDDNARSSGNGITIGPDGSVFVTGYGWEREIIPGTGRGRNKTPDTVINTAHWITRKMDPISGEWSVIDDYLGYGDAFAEVVHVTSDEILLVGGQSDSEFGGYWTLRAFDDDSNTWQTVDEFQLLPDSGSNRAMSITEGQDGIIYVGGTMDPDNINNSYTSGIRSSIDLVNWNTEDFPSEWVDLSIFSPVSSVLATKPDASGNSYLYVSESGPDIDGVLIRKLIP